ncbi:MAG: biotin/lipoate A/B protein ligase family protein [Chloroflexota bacterium]
MSLRTDTWRFLNLKSASGSWHMAVDEAVTQFHGLGTAPPTVRFYTWRPPCLSVGYFQSVRKDIDVGACVSQGIDLVRRPTGGRAILHDDELAYSIIALESEPAISGPVGDSFRKISAGIIEGLRILGINAAVGAQRPRRDTVPRTPACFNAASPHEVTVRGSKVVGSAQCRRGGVILQQGSIPLSLDTGKLFSFLKLPSQELAALARSQFEARVLPLRAILDAGVQAGEVAQALRKGLEMVLGVTLVEGELTMKEEKLAGELVSQKYGNQQWNLRR